jgi:hypothetical protein
MSRLQHYLLNEEFIEGFKVRKGYVEVFKNPSKKEYNELLGRNDDGVRAFLVKNDIYVWHIYGALHAEVDRKMKFGRNALPIVVYGDDLNKPDFVMVTDYTKNTSWYHNPDTANYIRNSSYLSNKKIRNIEISYFDEDIVGNWEEI